MMTDLFADFVPNEWIDRVFAVMALCPQHIFQVLTKRAGRLREYLTAARATAVGMEALELTLQAHARDPRSTVGAGVKLTGDIAHLKAWPLPNVWLGVSAEDQARADERVPELLATPAAIRFVSAEPLIGPIDFTSIRPTKESRLIGLPNVDALLGAHYADGHKPPHPDDHPGQVRLHWIIAGGESGPHARPMHPDWPRAIRDDCAAAGVAFFFKQWGEWAPAPDPAGDTWEAHRARGATDFHVWPDGHAAERVGKHRAGRLLDGVEHNAFPEVGS